MPSEKIRDFDETTSFLGDYGRFQILMMVLLSLSAVPCGYMGVIVIFVSDTPAHHCRAWGNSTRNGTAAAGLSASGDACFRNGSEPCPDGWVFSPERRTIVSEWDLVCDDAWKVPFSTSLFFLGVLFGSFISGQLSDRFGRKKVFFATMALQAVTTLIQAAAINWEMFCLLQCLRGMGQISNYVTSLVLGSEMLSKSARVSYTLLGHSLGFGAGYALLPLFAYLVRGWRMLLVATAVPCFFFIPTWWLIPESPRWLLHRGRVEEAERIIRQAAKTNKVPAPKVIFRAGECSELLQNKGEDEQTYTYMDLIRTPNIRNIMILGFFIWMTISMLFYGLVLNTSNLNGDIYINCFMSAAIDIVVYVATWLLINRVSRPTLLFSMLMFCGVALLVIGLVPDDMPALIQVLALAGKIGAAGGYCFIYVFFFELIPTVVRNMGLGICSTAARVGSIVCPYVIYIGIYDTFFPYIIFSTMSIIAALCSMLLPDTRTGKLPDLISQAKPVRSCSSPKENPAVLTSATAFSEDMNKGALCCRGSHVVGICSP